MTIDPSIGPDRARAVFDDELAAVSSAAALQDLRHRWIARSGSWVAAFMERLASAPPAEKKLLGRGANELKKHVEAGLAARETALASTRRPAGAVDITLPGRRPALGFRHPLSLIREEVGGIFSRLGYQVLEGPEIEDDYHNFEALNMPEEHPARDMQDTLYLAEPLQPASYEAPTRGRAPKGPQPLTLLRTHTSAMQIRQMERQDPPVRLVAIGPVYRRDNLDLTHTPMFHQVEGLVVGRGVTLADLKGTLTSMAAALFGQDQAVRFRPSFFPYTEPSAEVDIRCIRCRAAAAPCASAGAGSRSSGAAWCTRRSSSSSATTLPRSPGSPSAWASSAWPCSSGASRTSACSTRTTCASWSSSADEGPVFVAP
ncbi:MAG: phenylalanine--tRNA ligase subunit alpha [Vicinamibacterales bacterium]